MTTVLIVIFIVGLVVRGLVVRVESRRNNRLTEARRHAAAVHREEALLRAEQSSLAKQQGARTERRSMAAGEQQRRAESERMAAGQHSRQTSEIDPDTDDG